jgi:hypothetical protein
VGPYRDQAARRRAAIRGDDTGNTGTGTGNSGIEIVIVELVGLRRAI